MIGTFYQRTPAAKGKKRELAERRRTGGNVAITALGEQFRVSIGIELASDTRTAVKPNLVGGGSRY
jgi:hypothetical protein